jgi:hypothetical protein
MIFTLALVAALVAVLMWDDRRTRRKRYVRRSRHRLRRACVRRARKARRKCDMMRDIQLIFNSAADRRPYVPLAQLI